MSNVKKTHWLRNTLLVLIICGIVGTVLTVFQFRAESPAPYASAKIQFSFEKAAEGIAPDGMPFDVSGLTADEVISAGLEAAGLQDAYTVEQIRDNLTVTGEYPETYLEQMTKYVSLLSGGADTEQTISANYFPTQYSVSLSSDLDRNISAQKLTDLLGSILEAYRADFIKTHAIRPLQASLKDMIGDFDYPQQLDVLTEISSQRRRYATELEDLTEDFTWNGLSFGDIAVKYQALDSDIDRLNAQITLNVVSKDRERLQKRYEMEIRDQNNQLASLKEELKQIEELVDAYEKEGIIYVSSNGSLQKVGSNTSNTYDKLVTRRKEVADNIAAVNARISLYQSRLDDMTGAGAAAEETAKTETAAEEASVETTETAAAEATSEEDVLAAAAEVTEIAVSEQTEEDVARLNEAMEQRIGKLLEKEEAIEEQFSGLLKAYSDQKMNEATVAITGMEHKAPKYLSGAFVKKLLLTAGPICAVGLMICLVLMIIGRVKEQKKTKA